MKENPSKYGLIGKDIQYSLSPLIYNYWFNLYGINASYDLIDVSEISINLINNLKNQHYLGFNITQPYKQDILGYVSHLSKEVNEIKSCNLIIYKDSILEAYNSDYIGLLDSFKYFNLDLKNKNILILGAGGTTNALIYSLILLNIDNITISNTSGSDIVCNSYLKIINTLNLSAGKLSVQGYTLSIGTAGSNGSITGGSTSSYIKAYDNSGTIGAVKYFINTAGGTSYFYPIGDATNYVPLTFTLYVA